jgi:hypothetical protein
MLESDLMHEVIPESKDKSGDDLKPYTIKFDDAMYLFFNWGERTRRDIHTHAKEAINEWKITRGYLER